jgi:hypothetical protein
MVICRHAETAGAAAHYDGAMTRRVGEIHALRLNFPVAESNYW